MLESEQFIPDPRHLAQEAYVKQWRAEHPERMWQEGWACPLCRTVLQENALVHGLRVMVSNHQYSHGDDWIAYTEAGAALEAGGDRGGE